GIALWPSPCLGVENLCSRWPSQRAGFSPSRNSLTFAQSSTFSILPRVRLAVSGVLFQIGRRNLMTVGASIRDTFSGPKDADALASDFFHCARCLAFLNLERFSSR